MQFIELKDFILLPIYLIVIYIIAYNSRNRIYGPGNPLYKYYIPALSVKIIGALGIGLVYQYYYGVGGDTSNYYRNGKIVSEIFSTSLSDYLDLVFKPILSTLDIRAKINWTDSGFGYNESNYFPIRVLAVFELFTFQTYLPSAVLFAFLSFTGIWKAYSTIVHIFPVLYKEFAIAFLFMPSVFFWGSGILKDTLVIAALSWLFYASYMVFILRVNLMKGIFILVISIGTLLIIKPYVALTFLPSLVFLVFFTYRNRIKSHFLKVIALPLILFIVVAGGLFIIDTIGQQNQRFSADNLVGEAATFNANNMAAGSSVDVGISGNMGTLQLLKVAPLAIITTLFRPFIFEVSNPLMLLSALEGTYIIYLFGLILVRTGIVNAFRIISQNPMVSFCLIFSLIFAFAVGIATSNFGTLVRYKIPCIPFFMTALFIIRHQSQVLVVRRGFGKQA